MDALNNPIEHIVLTGDQDASKQYVPFAQKKANEIYNLSQQLNTPLTKFYVIDKTTIRIKIFGSNKFIQIDSQSKTTNTVKLPNYVSGVAHICQPVNGALHEFYKKGSTGFSDLSGYGIACNSFIDNIGYPTSTKTQQAYVKASMYTGFMQYAVQNSLGINEQIGYGFGFYNTDALLIETSKPSVIANQFSTYSYAVEGYIELRAIKVSNNGIYIKKVNHFLPTDFKFDLSQEWNISGWSSGIVQEHNTYGFNLDTEFSVNFQSITANVWNKTKQMQFIGLIKEKTFDIPTTLSNYIYDDGSVFQIADASFMADFYNKTPFYNSCGWLFLETPSIRHVGYETRGVYQQYTQLAFNTCHDSSSSYLYGLRINYKKIYLSDAFKLTEEYLTNPKYSNNNGYVYEYSVSLHKLLVGNLTGVNSNNKGWLQGNTGIYFPNENLLSVSRFNYNSTALVDTSFAPVHVVEPIFGNTMVTSIEDSLVNSYEAKGYTNIYLYTVGLMDMKVQPRKLTYQLDSFGNPTFEDHDSNAFYKNIEETLTNYFCPNWMTNLSPGTLELVLSPTEFYVKSFRFDSTGTGTTSGDMDLYTRDPNL